MKKILILLLGIFAAQFIFADSSNAQWGIGASVEIRDENPTTGVGLKLEREILSVIPIVDVHLRGHFSWFNDQDVESIIDQTHNTQVDVYDYGAALVVGLKLGIVKPYLGGGIGTEKYREESNTGILDNSYSENFFYWNGFGGAEISILPYLKPFIEFRFSKFTDPDEISFDSYNRLAIGLTLRF